MGAPHARHSDVSDQLLPLGSPNQDSGAVTPSPSQPSTTPPTGSGLRVARSSLNPHTRTVSLRYL